MTRKLYLGVVEKDPDSAYGMWFPDVPGCFPAANEFEDIPRIAAEMLSQHIEALERNRRAVPSPRSISKMMSDKSVRKAIDTCFATMLIPY